MIAHLILVLTAAFAATAPRTDKYVDVQKQLRELVSRYPRNATLIHIGMTDAGRPIEGLRIGDGPVKNLVVGTHHGNEYGAAEVARAMAASLAETPIQGQTVFVIPVLNSTGYDTRSRADYVNDKPLDPNRDYPGPCGSEGPFRLKITKALAEMVEREGIVSAATLHTKHPAVVWPWGFATPDLETPFTELFRMMAQAATVESGYTIGNSTEVVYPAPGTFEDHVFWKYGTWSLLFELGHTHTPSDPEVAQLVKVNVPGIRRMLEQAPRQRADHHEFTGKCDKSLFARDRHDE